MKKYLLIGAILLILAGVGLWGYTALASSSTHASVTNTSGAMVIKGNVIIK